MVRLVYKIKDGHIAVADNWEDVSMDWQIPKKEGIYKEYGNHTVVGLIGILSITKNSEAINIIIQEK